MLWNISMLVDLLGSSCHRENLFVLVFFLLSIFSHCLLDFCFFISFFFWWIIVHARCFLMWECIFEISSFSLEIHFSWFQVCQSLYPLVCAGYFLRIIQRCYMFYSASILLLVCSLSGSNVDLTVSSLNLFIFSLHISLISLFITWRISFLLISSLFVSFSLFVAFVIFSRFYVFSLPFWSSVDVFSCCLCRSLGGGVSLEM